VGNSHRGQNSATRKIAFRDSLVTAQPLGALPAEGGLYGVYGTRWARRNPNAACRNHRSRDAPAYEASQAHGVKGIIISSREVEAQQSVTAEPHRLTLLTRSPVLPKVPSLGGLSVGDRGYSTRAPPPLPRAPVSQRPRPHMLVDWRILAEEISTETGTSSF
jgi:hypothetical protein